MTRMWRQFLGLLAAMPMAIGGIAVSSSVAEARLPVEAAWAQAVQQGSLEAFAQFAMTYPDSAYAQLAYAKLSNPDAASIPEMVAAIQADDNSISEPGFVPSSMMVV